MRLEGGGAAPETFRVDAPSRPGIFGVDVKPARAGARELVIALKSARLTDDASRSRCDGAIPINRRRARRSKPPRRKPKASAFSRNSNGRSISAPSSAEERAIRESIRVPATIVARPGGAAQVVAPIDGRLIQVAPLGPGSAVTQGQELARLLPPPSVPGELPQLEQARAEAAACGRARRARSRARRAAGDRRCVAAEAPRRSARGRSAGAGAATRGRGADRAVQRGAQRHRRRQRERACSSSASPITGVIASRQATTGANVSGRHRRSSRWPMSSQVHVAGRIPEAQAAQAGSHDGRRDRSPRPRADSDSGPGDDAGQGARSRNAHAADRLRVRQPRLEAPARSIGVPAPADGRDGASTSSFPSSAVVDDAGRPIVFVQTERRIVRAAAGHARRARRRCRAGARGRQARRARRHEGCASRAARVAVDAGAGARPRALEADVDD